MNDFTDTRARMGDTQIERRGMRAVPRGLFVRPGDEALAHDDGPLAPLIGTQGWPERDPQ